MRAVKLAAALALPVALWALSPATHAEGPAAAHTGDGSSPTCAQCHDDPHQGQVGTDCESCHGTEHFAPSTFDVERHAQTAFALQGKHAEVSCNRCHTGGKLKGQPTVCNECHVDRHRGKLGDDCTECHGERGFRPVEGFDHERTGFTLTGSHAGPVCADCHQGAKGEALRMTATATCSTCHSPSLDGEGHGDLGSDCSSCHLAELPAWADAGTRHTFDHRATGFPLERRHKALACATCHVPDKPDPEPRCGSCHLDPHAGQLTFQCEDCHRPDRWRLARFDHDLSGWPLRGKHFVTPCAECHTSQRWIGLPDSCSECHAVDATIPGHGFDRQTCSDCHGTWNWRPI